MKARNNMTYTYYTQRLSDISSTTGYQQKWLQLKFYASNANTKYVNDVPGNVVSIGSPLIAVWNSDLEHSAQ